MKAHRIIPSALAIAAAAMMTAGASADALLFDDFQSAPNPANTAAPSTSLGWYLRTGDNDEAESGSVNSVNVGGGDFELQVGFGYDQISVRRYLDATWQADRIYTLSYRYRYLTDVAGDTNTGFNVLVRPVDANGGSLGLITSENSMVGSVGQTSSNTIVMSETDLTAAGAIGDQIGVWFFKSSDRDIYTVDNVKLTETLILVDYDDGLANGIHDKAIRNGGFESPNTAVDGEPFSNTDNWVNTQGGAAEQARRTNIKDTGSYSSVNETSASKNFALDTEHTIEVGDIFSLEFRALRAFNSTNASTITAELYYTDNDLIDGVATVIDDIVISNLPTTFATFGDTFDPLWSGAGAIGKNLFLRFEQSSGPGFTRTDGWYLTVTNIPSPAALPAGLILLTTLAGRRRRRS